MLLPHITCICPVAPSMKSGYSPPAIIVPIASSAVCPVSHVSFTPYACLFLDDLLDFIIIIDFRSRYSKKCGQTLSIFFCCFFPALGTVSDVWFSLPHPVNSAAVIADTSNMLTSLFFHVVTTSFFINLSDFLCYLYYLLSVQAEALPPVPSGNCSGSL